MVLVIVGFCTSIRPSTPAGVSRGRLFSSRPPFVLAYLDRLDATADLHAAVGARLGEDQGPSALPDRDPPPQQRGQPDGVGSGGFVFFYADAHREHPRADTPGPLVFPGPHPRGVVSAGRTLEGLHLGGGGELDVLVCRRPLGPPRDKGEIIL